MRLLSFDVLRTFEFPEVSHLKPEHWLRERDRVLDADCLLYPEYWQVNAMVYGWRRRIFPSISSYHLGHDKVEMTRAFEAMAPAHTPHTLVLPATPAALEQILDTFSFPFVGKCVRSSMGEGVYLLERRDDLVRYALNQPILYVQERLPIDRDLRIVWVGDQVLTAYWRQAPAGGFHNNVARGGAVSFEGIPAQALELVTRVALGLGIDHAGFDVALVDGHCYLLEFNVRFGTEALLRQGIRLAPAVLRYLQAALPARSPATLCHSILPRHAMLSF